jgi:hypothetical protein
MGEKPNKPLLLISRVGEEEKKKKKEEERKQLKNDRCNAMQNTTWV